jgi:formylglycine-generating enzyme
MNTKARPLRRLHTAWALMGAGTCVPTLAFALSLEQAPDESRAQVRNALRVLASGIGARSAATGTLEYVIAQYYPKKAWPVDEGTISAARENVHCPSGMALVRGRACVDLYEGALLDETGALASPYVPLEDGKSYRAVSRAGAIPQGYISANQAAAACKASGKRLCGAAEWRMACAGSKGTAFPYGAARIAKKCNETGKSGIVTYHADKLQTGLDRATLNDPRINQLENTVAKTGAFEGCVTDTGLFDMVGNLHEWTADSNGTFQGGYYLDTHEHGDGCAYRTIVHNADYHDYSTGFRCCADPLND